MNKELNCEQRAERSGCWTAPKQLVIFVITYPARAVLSSEFAPVLVRMALAPPLCRVHEVWADTLQRKEKYEGAFTKSGYCESRTRKTFATGFFFFYKKKTSPSTGLRVLERERRAEFEGQNLLNPWLKCCGWQYQLFSSDLGHIVVHRGSIPKDTRMNE